MDSLFLGSKTSRGPCPFRLAYGPHCQGHRPMRSPMRCQWWAMVGVWGSVMVSLRDSEDRLTGACGVVGDLSWMAMWLRGGSSWGLCRESGA